ncbi:lipopolysaccharide biosynthesis protein [Marinomonas aquiplantarum]|uniref:O-antigen/teichoic acid export membrane protein n=1 Tax=Marinomonas aquiplantarum TaxID=491951 RepID=A0A366D8F1_9GAMM|nr:oligosaccharide flippase family protein [Marinomonas aquiplantarum]RBO85744.1 O-antigen/teichoic acid export membrane protein [Marinomonas aquiplantarum]
MKQVDVIRKKQIQNTFARGVSVLVGGTASAQLLLVLVSPLLTRLYTPDDFGVLAVYASILSITTVFGCLRYEIAIPLPKTDIAAMNIMALCAIILIFLTVIMTVTAVFWGEWLLDALNISRLLPFVWLIPLGFFLTGSYSILNKWAIRKKKYKDVAMTKLHQSFSMLLIQTVFFKFGAAVLLFGQAVGQGFGFIRLVRIVDIVYLVKKIQLKRIKKLAVRYKNFPLFSTWTGIFNAVGGQLPPLIFAALFSSNVAGLYALAHRVVSMPASIIGQAVANVFLSSAPQARREGNLDQLLFKVVLTLAMLAFPAGMFMVINAEVLFSLVFGDNWRVAGVYAAILVPMLLMGFVTAPVTTLCAVLDKQFAGTIFQFTMMSVRIVSIGLGVYISDPVLALLAFSVSSSACYLAFLLWLTTVSGGSSVRMVVILCQAAMVSVLVLVSVDGFNYFYMIRGGSALIDVFISSMAMLVAYGVNYKVWKSYVKT